VYIYTDGMRRKATVMAPAGQTTEVDAKLGREDSFSPSEKAGLQGAPVYVPPSQQGIYALLSLGAAAMGNTTPAGIVDEKQRAAGGFGTLRAGYRFSTLFGVELDISTSTHGVSACVAAPINCADGRGNYQIASTRIGPAARLMTSGRKGRAVGTIGLGPAVHSVSFDGALRALGRGDASAVGTYLEITGSYELSLGHLLLGAGLNLVAENAEKAGIKSAVSAGLALQVGYGQW
jgi:hypothetical protein